MISEINFQQNFCQTMTQFGKNFIKFCRSFIGLSYFTAGHSIPGSAATAMPGIGRQSDQLLGPSGQRRTKLPHYGPGAHRHYAG